MAYGRPPSPPKPLDEARRALAADHYPLALRYAEGAASRFPHRRDEILSAAGEACCRAAATCDLARPFKPLLKTSVLRACVDAVRYGGLRIAPSLKLLYWEDICRPGKRTYVRDSSYTDPAAPDERPAAVRALDGPEFDRLAGLCFNPRDAEALGLMYRDGLTGYEAAERLGVTHQRVYAMVKRGLQNIKDRLPEGYAA